MEKLIEIYTYKIWNSYGEGKFISAHLHLDCCFLFEANEEDYLKIKEDENSSVK